MEKLALLGFLGAVLLFFLAGGILALRRDLSGLFCVYREGWIWTARGRRLLPDTPGNRRRVSRRLGIFLLVLDGAAGLILLLAAVQAP